MIPSYFSFLVAPSVTALEPQNQTVTMPAPAEFTCNATGRPRPTVLWYTMALDDSRELLSGGVEVMIDEIRTGMREISSVLTILSTTPPDATRYVCVTTNVVDTAEMSATLTVHGKGCMKATFEILQSCVQ